MKIKLLKVNEFRHMHDLEIQFGEFLTVISGLNGTGKSSILGLVGHVFDYKGPEKTKNGRRFSAKYSEIFKFCPKHDQKQTYEYEAVVDNNNDLISKKVKSRYIKAEKRYRLDVGGRTKEGEGTIDCPVVYLGLRRLYPLAQEEDIDIKIQTLGLSQDEIIFYNKECKEIFVYLNQDLPPERVKTPNKEFLAIETSEYGSLGNSAGQDNIGQILTAILSLKALGKGGIFLIDEVDATLFAGVQRQLIERLYGYARKFNIQIVFTTHSLEIINHLKNKPEWNSKINFLEICNSNVKNTVDPSLSYIQSRILLQTKQVIPSKKYNLLCEDKVAEFWCKSLLNGKRIKPHLNVYGTNISDGSLADAASKKLPCFKDFVFVLDGDGTKRKDFKHISNLAFLPGRMRPETVMFDFLKGLPDDDKFWGGTDHYYKDVCFRGHATANTKSDHKKWWDQNSPHFGSGCSKLFNRWKESNKTSVDEFISSLEKVLEDRITVGV